jgi:hypothetical protein
MTTRPFSYALKLKHPGGLCLIIIGTEGRLGAVLAEIRAQQIQEGEPKRSAKAPRRHGQINPLFTVA